ncbi:MAG: hypothetical protein JNM89_14035 [Hyphomicrobiaceae bacterium]|nr:hypothetical protein [Hyphomicrobiaceae bacterium]
MPGAETRSSSGNLLSIIGVIGGAVTLFSNAATILDTLEIIRTVIDQWRTWLHLFWSTLFGWIGIRVHPFFVIPLSIIVFMLQLLVGVRLTRIAANLKAPNWDLCGRSAKCETREITHGDWLRNRDRWVEGKLLERRVALGLREGDRDQGRGPATLRFTKEYPIPEPTPPNCECMGLLRDMTRNARLQRGAVTTVQLGDMQAYSRWQNPSMMTVLWAAYLTIIGCAAVATSKNSLFGYFAADFVAIFLLMWFAAYAIKLSIDTAAYDSYEALAIIYRVYDRIILSVALLIVLIVTNYGAIAINYFWHSKAGT